jgi:hypothetical protein
MTDPMSEPNDMDYEDQHRKKKMSKKSYRIESFFIDQDYLDGCLQEFHNAAVRKNLGQPPNKLELLAINVLEPYIRKFVDETKKMNEKKDNAN